MDIYPKAIGSRAVSVTLPGCPVERVADVDGTRRAVSKG